MKKKFLLSLAPALLVAAMALGVGVSSVSAAACTVNVLCNNANEKLRDGVPEPTEYGTSALAVNTAGKLRLCATVSGLKACNENPKGYAFFGVKLVKNPPTGNCEEALGNVNFVDIQNASTGGLASPAFDKIPWPLKLRSDKCTTNPGGVTIENVWLYFPAFHELKATGTITGKWVQPGSCPGGSGGIELAVVQTGLALSIGSSPEIDNGTTGKNAFVCFVSSNNYLYPTTAPTWEPFTGNIWKD